MEMGREVEVNHQTQDAQLQSIGRRRRYSSETTYVELSAAVHVWFTLGTVMLSRAEVWLQHLQVLIIGLGTLAACLQGREKHGSITL